MVLNVYPVSLLVTYPGRDLPHKFGCPSARSDLEATDCALHCPSPRSAPSSTVDTPRCRTLLVWRSAVSMNENIVMEGDSNASLTMFVFRVAAETDDGSSDDNGRRLDTHTWPLGHGRALFVVHSAWSRAGTRFRCILWTRWTGLITGSVYCVFWTLAFRRANRSCSASSTVFRASIVEERVEVILVSSTGRRHQYDFDGTVPVTRGVVRLDPVGRPGLTSPRQCARNLALGRTRRAGARLSRDDQRARSLWRGRCWRVLPWHRGR